MTRFPRRLAPALAALALAGCFSGTSAEDPLPGPMQDATIHADPDTRERLVRVSALVGAPPASVFRWLSDEALLERWYADEVTMDQGAWTARGQDGAWSTGTPSRLEPPLLLAVDVAPQADLPARSLLFTLAPEDDGTRVTVQDGPFPDGVEGQRMAEDVRKRWSRSFGVLRSAVLRGPGLGRPPEWDVDAPVDANPLDDAAPVAEPVRPVPEQP